VGAFSGLTKRCDSSTRQQYPLLILSLKAVRKWKFYMFSVVMPMFMLTLLSFPVALVPISAFEVRFGIYLTLLVAAVTSNNILRDSLPKVLQRLCA
jgi:hypothetical protein